MNDICEAVFSFGDERPLLPHELRAITISPYLEGVGSFRAERLFPAEGVDYGAFVARGLFVGAANQWTHGCEPWSPDWRGFSMAQLFECLRWVRGPFGERLAAPLDVCWPAASIHLQVENCGIVPRRFAARLVGLSWGRPS